MDLLVRTFVSNYRFKVSEATSYWRMWLTHSVELLDSRLAVRMCRAGCAVHGLWCAAVETRRPCWSLVATECYVATDLFRRVHLDAWSATGWVYLSALVRGVWRCLPGLCFFQLSVRVVFFVCLNMNIYHRADAGCSHRAFVFLPAFAAFAFAFLQILPSGLILCCTRRSEAKKFVLMWFLCVLGVAATIGLLEVRTVEPFFFGNLFSVDCSCLSFLLACLCLSAFIHLSTGVGVAAHTQYLTISYSVVFIGVYPLCSVPLVPSCVVIIKRFEGKTHEVCVAAGQFDCLGCLLSMAVRCCFSLLSDHSMSVLFWPYKSDICSCHTNREA